MKSFNLNNKILVQITDYGWSELLKHHGQKYIDVCITPYKKIINNVDYYELQAHNIITLWDKSLWWTHPCPISPVILIPE